MMDLEEQKLSGRILGAEGDGAVSIWWRGTRSRQTYLWAAILALVIATAWSPGSLSAADITDANVADMVKAAKTPEDHEALAAYFSSKAAQAGEMAKMHESMLGAFQGGKTTEQSLWKGHCNNLIRSFRNQQADYQAMAKEQQTIAKTLSGMHK